MYGVNAGVPKTLVRHLVKYYADTCGDEALAAVLGDVLRQVKEPRTGERGEKASGRAERGLSRAAGQW